MARGRGARNHTSTTQGRARSMSDHSERRTVPTNIYRSEGRVTLAALMPGVEPEDIHVEVTSDGRLILDGAWRGSLKGINEILQNEWQAGGYYREFMLPSPVDGGLANLTFGNGVLVVVLPVSDVLRPARLSLKAIGPAQGERVGNAGHPVRPL